MEETVSFKQLILNLGLGLNDGRPIEICFLNNESRSKHVEILRNVYDIHWYFEIFKILNKNESNTLWFNYKAINDGYNWTEDRLFICKGGPFQLSPIEYKEVEYGKFQKVDD